jgi:hypothetical protein
LTLYSPPYKVGAVLDIRAELDELLRIADPVERASKALRVMDQARELQSTMAQVRGLAVYQTYASQGAGRAAASHGISRAGLYRIIAEHAPPEVKQARRETAAVVAVAALVMLAVAKGSRMTEDWPHHLSSPDDAAKLFEKLQQQAAFDGAVTAPRQQNHHSDVNDGAASALLRSTETTGLHGQAVAGRPYPEPDFSVRSDKGEG